MRTTTTSRFSDSLLHRTISRRSAIALGAGALGMTMTTSSPSTTSASDSPVPPLPADVPVYSSLATAVQAEAGRWNIPGISAAILHNGERTSAATGVTNLEYPVPVTPDTRFQIGSISKVFTATVIMSLVDEGRLDLDTPVWEWVPDLAIQRADAYADLSLRHLFNHTTGFEGDYFFDMGDGDDALAASIARFDEVHTWTAPGEVVAYCNLGINLGGRIIELVTGQSFESVMAERIFGPLGLETAAFPSPELVTWPTASGHTLISPEDGHMVFRPWALPRTQNAAGGIASTTDDLLSFAEMHMNGGILNQTRVLSEDSAGEMRIRTSKTGFLEEGYGIGWNIVHGDGISFVNHGGATYGCRAWLLTVPEHDFALAILTNSDQGLNATQTLETWALRHYLGIESEQREVIEIPEADLDAVTGRYERHNMVVDVWRVDDHLHIEQRFTDDSFAGLPPEEVPILTSTVWPSGDNVFIDPAGIPLDTLAEFFEAPVFDGSETNELSLQPMMRMGASQLARRIGDAPDGGPTQAP